MPSTGSVLGLGVLGVMIPGTPNVAPTARRTVNFIPGTPDLSGSGEATPAAGIDPAVLLLLAGPRGGPAGPLWFLVEAAPLDFAAATAAPLGWMAADALPLDAATAAPGLDHVQADPL